MTTLPHHTKLAEMEFVLGAMRNTDSELKRIAEILDCFQRGVVQFDLDQMAEELHDGEWPQLTQAADASLAHVIFNNLSAAQKEVLRSLLAEE